MIHVVGRAMGSVKQIRRHKYRWKFVRSVFKRVWKEAGRAGVKLSIDEEQKKVFEILYGGQKMKIMRICDIEGFENVDDNLFATLDGYVWRERNGKHIEIKCGQISTKCKLTSLSKNKLYGTWKYGYKKGQKYERADLGERVSYYNVKEYSPRKCERRWIKQPKDTNKIDDIATLKFFKKENSTQGYNTVCERLLKRKGREYLEEVLKEVS